TTLMPAWQPPPSAPATPLVPETMAMPARPQPAAGVAAGPQAELTFESGPDAGHTHRAADRAVRLGRSPDNDVILRDPATSGQHASSIAVKTVTKVLSEDGQEGPDVDRLKRACKEANTAVFNAARDNPDWSGMGSTMVVAAIRSGEVALLNVGDSPAYLFRNGL